MKLFAALVLAAFPWQVFAAQGPLDKTIQTISKQSLKAVKAKDAAVAVLPFLSLESERSVLNKQIAENLTVEIQQSKKIKPHDSDFTFTLFDHLNLSKSTIIGPRIAQLIGRLCGTDFVLTGTIQRAGEKLRIDSKLYRTETAKVEKVTESEISANPALAELLKQPYVTVPDGPADKDPRKQAVPDFVKLMDEHSQLQNEIERNPGDASAPFLKSQLGIESAIRGNLLFLLKKYAESVPEFVRAVESGHRTAELFYNLALARDRSGSLESALSAYSDALKLNPRLPNAYFNRARAYHLTGKPSEAIEDYAKALTLNPNDAEAALFRGECYVANSEYEKSLEDFSQAMALKPNDYRIYLDRGIALYKGGNTDGALTDLKRALELNPKEASAYYFRGLIYSRTGEYNYEMEDYDQALALNPNLSEAYTDRGIAYYVQGKTSRAIEDFNSALKLNGGDARAYYNRGTAYNRVGQRPAAMADFKKACELGVKQACTEIQTQRGR